MSPGRRTCDVLVVGGGPAGSSAAWALRRGGLDVTVVDRAEFPRDKVCAGWITPAVAASLELDLEAYGRGRVLQPIRAFRVATMGGPVVTTRRRERPVSYGILRREFDDYLLRRSGARMLLGRPLAGLRRSGGRWTTEDGLAADLVIGAGGHFCPVARTLGAAPGGDGPVVLAREVEFAMTPAQARACPVDPEVPELWFCSDLAGYGWIFRKGNHLNVGLGREDPKGLARHASAFVDGLIAAGRLPRDTPRRMRGHAYALYPRATRTTHGDGFMLVGDAAGLAYPESGEGIRPAIESGLLAAATAVESAGHAGGASLAGYGERLARRFGDRRPRRALAGWIPAGLTRRAAAALLRNESFVRRVVVDRWFLRRAVPPLAPPSVAA